MKAKYKIIKLLGEGAFGKAYLAKSDNEDEQYVIKQVIMEEMTDQEKRDTFNEAIILKKLDHPNIIKFKEVFRQKRPKDALNIVTEFADGGDLGQKIEEQKKKPFPESQILDYITQICLALQHIHKKHIIHRDLKSNNVFLMKSGIVKVGDFGIAKGLKSTWDKAKTMVGTPYYLSPEIINSKPYDSKSDIWALGVLLYELMTFKMPFNAVSLPLLSIKINRGVYAPPPGIYSSELKDLLKKCLTLDPKGRPTINEILQLPLIKERINHFLKEVQYDQDLSKTMAKKYKDKKKEEKKNENKKEEESKKVEQKKEDKNVKTEENKRQTKDKKKLTNFFQKKKGDENKQTLTAEQLINKENSDNKASSSTSHDKSTKKSLNETNFLMQRKDPDFKEGKKYKEDEIGKTLKAKGFKDLVNEKNDFDVNKMNEDQYNQLRLLNNLHNIANNQQQQESDSETSVNTSITSLPSAKSENDSLILDDISFKDVPKETKKKEVSKETINEEKKEIENIKKEIEKEIGNDLLKEVSNIFDKNSDKTEVKFDREALTQKIKELSSKGFDKAKLDKAVEKVDEIFAVFMKDKIFA
jgi:NIMA (never in mitosis gene a)-related kinase